MNVDNNPPPVNLHKNEQSGKCHLFSKTSVVALGVILFLAGLYLYFYTKGSDLRTAGQGCLAASFITFAIASCCGEEQKLSSTSQPVYKPQRPLNLNSKVKVQVPPAKKQTPAEKAPNFLLVGNVKGALSEIEKIPAEDSKTKKTLLLKVVKELVMIKQDIVQAEVIAMKLEPELSPSEQDQCSDDIAFGWLNCKQNPAQALTWVKKMSPDNEKRNTQLCNIAIHYILDKKNELNQALTILKMVKGKADVVNRIIDTLVLEFEKNNEVDKAKSARAWLETRVG